MRESEICSLNLLNIDAILTSIDAEHYLPAAKVKTFIFTFTVFAERETYLA